MVEKLGHDIGFSLFAQCDTCGEQIIAFGSRIEYSPTIGTKERTELEGDLKREGWVYLGDGSWSCQRCAVDANSPSQTQDASSKSN